MYGERLRQLRQGVAMRWRRRNTVAVPTDSDENGKTWSALADVSESDIQFTSSEALLFSRVRARLRPDQATAATKPCRWPQNLTPWSNEPLASAPPSADTLFGRLAGRWQWLLAHPQTRLQTLAWHHNARRTSKWHWRLHALRRTLRGMPTGSPPR